MDTIKKVSGVLNKIFIVLFFSVFIAAGLGIIIGVSLYVINGNASKTWPTTDGRIAVSKVDRVVSHTRNHTEIDYDVVVSYEFFVNGKKYTGDRVSFESMSFDTRAEANNAAKAYPINKKLKVYYSPKEPENSTLVTGMSMSILYFVIPFGLVFFLAGFLMLLKHIRMWIRESQAAKSSTKQYGMQ